MTRWAFRLYGDGEGEPFHSTYHDDQGRTDEAGLSLDLAVALRVATIDDRVERIELVRQVTR
jgi:hypothetical protein